MATICDNKEQILYTVAGALALNPNASMADLAKAANVSRVSLFRNFKNKDNIIQIIIRECKNNHAYIREKFLQADEDWKQALTNLIEHHVKYRNAVLFVNTRPFTEMITSDEWNKLMQDYADFMQRGKDTGFLQSNLTAFELTAAFVGIVCGIIQISLYYEVLNKEAVIHTIYTAFMGGAQKPLDE